MRRIFAIAAITIRTAVRSRVILCLLGILLALVAGLPLTVKGDGTIEGQVQIVIGYTLGIACVLLSMSTLWAGCAAVATEIQEKQIQMLVAKPVGRGQIWIGKWCGLMAMNVVLLIVCVAATYGLLRWTMRPVRLNPAERERLERDVLVAKREVGPPPVNVEEEVRKEYEAMQKSGKIPADSDPDQVVESLRRVARGRAGAIGPGQARSWRIDLPEAIDQNAEMTLRFTFACSSLERNPLAGMWLAGPPGTIDAFRLPTTNVPSSYHEVKIPARVLRGGTALVLSYANLDDSGTTVVFDANDALALKLPAGGFFENLLRASLIVLAQLAFLTALGVTAGSMFSLPVAGFISVFAILLVFSGGMIHDMSTAKIIIGNARDNAAWEKAANAVLHVVYQGLNYVTQPLDFDSPWGDVATAKLVSWARVAKSVLVNIVLYGGLIAAFGTYVFNRREVALPQS